MQLKCIATAKYIQVSTVFHSVRPAYLDGSVLYQKDQFNIFGIRIFSIRILQTLSERKPVKTSPLFLLLAYPYLLV